jgi:ATP-dependent Clp protease ATP-binding subunit ClpX
VRQYQKLFDIENVHPKFTQGHCARSCARRSSAKSGARGLRAMMEIITVELMYEISSQSNIKEAIISEEV